MVNASYNWRETSSLQNFSLLASFLISIEDRWIFEIKFDKRAIESHVLTRLENIWSKYINNESSSIVELSQDVSWQRKISTLNKRKYRHQKNMKKIYQKRVYTNRNGFINCCELLTYWWKEIIYVRDHEVIYDANKLLVFTFLQFPLLRVEMFKLWAVIERCVTKSFALI